MGNQEDPYEVDYIEPHLCLLICLQSITEIKHCDDYCRRLIPIFFETLLEGFYAKVDNSVYPEKLDIEDESDAELTSIDNFIPFHHEDQHEWGDEESI